MDKQCSLIPAYKAASIFLENIDKKEYKDELFIRIEDERTPGFYECPEYFVPIYEDFLYKSLLPHKEHVYREGLKLKKYVHINDLLWERQLIFHDLSKFSLSEEGYSRYFYGDKNMKKQSLKEKDYYNRYYASFKYAWFHHKSSNKHHPEWWHSVERNGRTSEVFPMENRYAIEMIADWAASSKLQGISLNEWIDGNIYKFKFHEDTLSQIFKPLAEIYGIFIDTNLILKRNRSYEKYKKN